MSRVKLYTIGFTKTSAERFFSALRTAGVKRVVDVRLNNTSQLSAFAKKDDLKFFLKEILGASYVHMPELAPTQDILDAYKKKKGEWTEYEQRFRQLMESRRVDETIQQSALHESCLLCSEHEPDFCHRRLVAEFLSERWGNVDTIHLG